LGSDAGCREEECRERQDQRPPELRNSDRLHEGAP
jgi:hypothetical protein